MTERIFQANNLSFAYNGKADGKNAVDGIDLTIAAGKFYAIVGPNGCGKTTLLDLLCGYKEPDTGEVLFRGEPVTKWPKSALAREIALVPQEFAGGFGFSTEEAVMMGRHPYLRRFAAPTADDWRKVDEAMAEVGVEELRLRPLTALSGGQKQRVVVARALAQDTPVILFDEATSNLDVRFSMKIFSLVRQLTRQQGRTALAVIHNLNLAAAFCDRMIFMKNGKIAANGETSEVLTGTTVEALFEIEAEVAWNDFAGAPQVHYRGQY